MKEHPIHKGYFITEDGKVFSSHTNKFLSQEIDRSGYKIVTLRKYNKHFKVHRLVAETYIPNQENKPQVNHIDRNRSNNNLSNLEWVTSKENAMHKVVNQNIWIIEQISTGKVWKVSNLLDFCKEYNLDYCLRKTLNKNSGRTQHKGFRIIGKEKISISLP
jgi:hypothetical protein